MNENKRKEQTENLQPQLSRDRVFPLLFIQQIEISFTI